MLKSSYLIFIILALLISACSKDQASFAMQGKLWPKLPMIPLEENQDNKQKVNAGFLSFNGANSNKTWHFINIWATWCEPCRKEMPLLAQMASRFNQDDLTLLLVSIDTDLNLVKEFALQFDLTAPIYLTDEANINQLLNHFTYPVSYLINPEGRIVRVFSGAKMWQSDEMFAELKKLMGNKA